MKVTKDWVPKHAHHEALPAHLKFSRANLTLKTRAKCEPPLLELRKRVAREPVGLEGGRVHGRFLLRLSGQRLPTNSHGVAEEECECAAPRRLCGRVPSVFEGAALFAVPLRVLVVPRFSALLSEDGIQSRAECDCLCSWPVLERRAPPVPHFSRKRALRTV